MITEPFPAFIYFPVCIRHHSSSQSFSHSLPQRMDFLFLISHLSGSSATPPALVRVGQFTFLFREGRYHCMALVEVAGNGLQEPDRRLGTRSREVESPLFSSVQVYGVVSPSLHSPSYRPSFEKSRAEPIYRFRLSRATFFAGKSATLFPVAPSWPETQ